MNELPDFPIEDGFLLMWPCFTVLLKDRFGSVVQEVDEGTIAFVLLTDQDLVFRYQTIHGYPDNPVQAFYDAGQLRTFLALVPPQITHVMLDPLPGTSPNMYPIGPFRELLAKHEADD